MDESADELSALKTVLELAHQGALSEHDADPEMMIEVEDQADAINIVDKLIERVDKLNNGHEWAWSEYLQAQLKELGLHVVVMVETKTVRDWLVPYEEAGDLEGVPDVLTNEQAALILTEAVDEWPGDMAWDSLQSEVWTAAKDVLDLEK